MRLATAAALPILLGALLQPPRIEPLQVSAEAPYYGALQAATLHHAGQITGAELTLDRAAFDFERGDLYLLDAVGGRSTGAVFLGKGRFRLLPPDGVERQQVDKFFHQESVDVEFKELTLRFTGSAGDRLAALAQPGGKVDLKKASKLWRKRHEEILEDRLVDLNARVAMDLAEINAGTQPLGPGYFFAEIEAKGGISLELDPFNQEEVRLYQSHGSKRSWDNWTAFHRQDDYAPFASGDATLARLPTQEHWRPAVEVPQVSIDLALQSKDIDATTELRIRALRPQTTLRLSISPILTVREVRWDPGPRQGPWPDPQWMQIGDPRHPHEPDGEPVPFLQAHVGRGLDEDRTEPSVTIFLPRPLATGEEITLQVRYDGKLFEQLPNRAYFHRDTVGWFPQHPHARRCRYEMLYRTPSNRRVATPGTLQEQVERDGRRIERWVVGRPEATLSFYYGDLKLEEHIPTGQPPIDVYYSPNMAVLSAGKRGEVLEDLTAATELYSDYYGPPPFDHLVITETTALGGQSFAGFLMLSFDAFGGMHTGESDLFRTHELAHQWWGNAVRWSTYHDQWMSEGFAQYSAALYTLLKLEKQDRFDEMMSAWAKDVLARPDVAQRMGMRHYGYSPGALRDSDGAESGPLWVGYRLASDKTPMDYRLQIYEKGAYVLHMLRMMLYDWDTGSDQRFRDLMRTFFRRYQGGEASTEDFLAAVSEAFGQPMDWFFDQWVYGVGVPKYDADLDGRQRDGQWRLQGRIRQKQVLEGFRMPVPVRVAYKNGGSEVFRIQVDAPEVPVDLALRGRPDKIELNPMHSVLARR